MTLDVLLHGASIGCITKDENTAALSFILNEAYLEDPAHPVLGQQFEDRRGHRVFRQSSHPGRLPSFFANLLPEGALRDMITAQCPGDDAALLARLGEDLPGAVFIRPLGPSAAMPAQGKTFDEPSPDGPSIDAAELRFSLAGTQLKFSAVQDAEARFTLPFHGQDGRWIIKFGAARYADLPRNEFCTMRWAQKAGLDVPQHALISARTIQGLDPRFLSLGEEVFCIKRYDRREDGSRVHQEDFAQVRGIPPEPDELKYGSWSYDGMARFIADLCGPDALKEFIQRVVFLVLSGNTDGHLKNWSLIYPDRRTAALGPAYDLVFVRQYLPRSNLALPLVKEKDPRRIGLEHFLRLERYLTAHGHPLPIGELVRGFVARCLDTWAALRMDADPAYRTDLEAYLAGLPLAQVR